MESKLRILVVGCGNMGSAHVRAYASIKDFTIVGLVSRGNSNSLLGTNYPLYNDYYAALRRTKPDAVCIATYPDTHEAYAIAAFEQGCHVFVEKPLADTIVGAQNVIDAANRANKKLVVGYILRHHPSWIRFIDQARNMGTPLVMRMNLNQQSTGKMWDLHKNLMKSLSPIVDCGVHYIDVMCQMTDSKPVRVSAIGARLTNDIPADNYNYGQLQIQFENGSIGWYEAGWGPMISNTASFVKDVFGPLGSVSLVSTQDTNTIESHVNADCLKIHRMNANDYTICLKDSPDHQELCNRQQEYFLHTIRNNIDLTREIQDAYNSLVIALSCDESVRTGDTVSL